MSCCDKIIRPPPGVKKIFVNKGNLTRNRIEGNPVILPAIEVHQDNKRNFCTSLEILGPSRVVQVDSESPSVWIETMSEIVMKVEKE